MKVESHHSQKTKEATCSRTSQVFPRLLLEPRASTDLIENFLCVSQASAGSEPLQPIDTARVSISFSEPPKQNQYIAQKSLYQ